MKIAITGATASPLSTRAVVACSGLEYGDRITVTSVYPMRAG